MGLTERHWFENEDVPENYEWALEDAVYNSRTNKKRDDEVRMINRDKVINELMKLHGTKETVNVIFDAIVLLKKQEPILLENQHKPYGISTNANSPWISRCPRCGKKVEGKQTRFCKYCGQAVKWE